MINEIKALLFDIDGSIMPQGGPIDPRVAAIFRWLKKLSIPMGPATGKNADYARGLAVGIGLHWDHISAETGAQFLRLVLESPVTWEQKDNLGVGLDQLSLFAQIIQLDPLTRRFIHRHNGVGYRPELKEAIITIFPKGSDIKTSEDWLVFFEEIIKTHRLSLVAKRHGDGCIDIVPSSITKRLGVMEVCRIYGCEPGQILTVVDGSNDDELATDTTCIAVANAVPKMKEIVKKQGGFLASLPDGFGFAEGLLHFTRKGLLPQKLEKIILDILPGADTAQDPAF